MSLYGGENWKSVETNIALSSEFITKMKINDNWKKKLSLGLPQSGCFTKV